MRENRYPITGLPYTAQEISNLATRAISSNPGVVKIRKGDDLPFSMLTYTCPLGIKERVILGRKYFLSGQDKIKGDILGRGENGSVQVAYFLQEERRRNGEIFYTLTEKKAAFKSIDFEKEPATGLGEAELSLREREKEITSQFYNKEVPPGGVLVEKQSGRMKYGFFMDLIPGKSLNKIALQISSLTKKVSLAEKICQELLELHSQGYAHRDLAAGNIMFDEAENQVCIMDFGTSIELSKCDSNEEGLFYDFKKLEMVLAFLFFGKDPLRPEDAWRPQGGYLNAYSGRSNRLRRVAAFLDEMHKDYYGEDRSFSIKIENVQEFFEGLKGNSCSSAFEVVKRVFS